MNRTMRGISQPGATVGGSRQARVSCSSIQPLSDRYLSRERQRCRPVAGVAPQRGCVKVRRLALGIQVYSVALSDWEYRVLGLEASKPMQVFRMPSSNEKAGPICSRMQSSWPSPAVEGAASVQLALFYDISLYCTSAQQYSLEYCESVCRLGTTCRRRPAHAAQTAVASADASGSAQQATGGQLPAIGGNQQLQQDSSVSNDLSQ